MPTSYTKADGDVMEIVGKVMHEHHSDLEKAGVIVDVLLAQAEHDEDGNPKADPVKLGGYACSAVIRRTSLKQRALGHGDAEIVIDEDRWNAMSQERQEALIDHELTHLMLAKDKDGHLKRDDQNRAVLKMRLHDWQLGGFAEIVERHGSAAPDLVEARKLEANYGQLLFQFADAK